MPEKDFTFTPDSILSQVGQLTLPPPVMVRGKVVKANNFTPPNSTVPKYTYGRLQGDDVEIGFRCPYANAPQMGQLVVLKGALILKQNSGGDGLDVMLEGEPIGVWEPVDFNGVATVELEKHSPLSLAAFLRKSGPEKLAVIGNVRGSHDMLSALDGRSLRFFKVQAMENNPLIEAVDEALNEQMEGVVFVRGGGEDMSFKVWNDPAFVHALLQKPCKVYTAISHFDNVSLTDKYSDEAFATPTAIGARILQTMEQIEYDQQVDRHLTALETDLKSTRQSLAQAEKESKSNASRASFWKILFVCVTLGAGLLAFWHFWSNGKINF